MTPPPMKVKKITIDTVATISALAHVVSVSPILGVNAKTMTLEGQTKKIWGSLTAYDPSSQVFDLPLMAGRNLEVDDLDKIVVGHNS